MTPTRESGSTTAQRLRAARHVLRTRGDALTVGDLVYAIYVGLLTLALVGSPAALAVVEFLRLPVVMDALTSTHAETVVGLLAGLTFAAAVVAGAARGPIIFDPFVVHALLGSDLPRARVAARSAVLTLALCAVSAAVIGGLIAGAFEEITAKEAAAAVVGAMLWGVVCWGGWLLGQRLGSPRAGVVAASVAVASAAGTAVPVGAALAPWGWIAALWPGNGTASFLWLSADGGLPSAEQLTALLPPASASADATWPLVGLATLAVVTLALAPRLLAGLRTAEVLAQTHRWQAATAATGSADLAGALAYYRARPRVGRRWRAVVGPRSVVVARADLVGAARTPGRFGVGTVGAILVGALAATVTAPTPVPAWVLLGIAGLLAVGPAGVVTDGFRDAASEAAGPPVLGYSTAGLFARHSVAPLVWGASCAAVGGLIALTWGAGPDGVLVACAVSVLAVALRLSDSVRGPLPLRLFVPVMTPVGDASSVAVALWQVEMPLLAGLAGAASAQVADGDALTASAWVLTCAAGAVAIARRRVSRL